MTRHLPEKPVARRSLPGVFALVAVAALTSCVGATSQMDTAPAPRLVAPGTLTVCSDLPYAPFESLQDGTAVGFDIDLVRRVADRLEVELAVVDTEFEDIQSGLSLNRGDCDLVVSAMTVTGDRARVLDFSSPYFRASQALVTRVGSGITELEEVSGRTVAVQAGTTGEVYLSDHAPSGATVLPLPDVAAVNRALVEGRAEAAFYDHTIVAPVLAAHDELEVAAEIETGEQYAMAAKKDGAADLLRVVNDELAQVRRDGTYDTLHERWFGASTAQ